MKQATRDYQCATSLVHGLDLLRSFRFDAPMLSNGQLAQRTGLSKATISRLTYTLTAMGFLNFDPALRTYQLGGAAVSMGYPLLVSLRVRQLARPLMQALAVEVGGSVSLGMRDRQQLVYLETFGSNQPTAFLPDMGASIPMLPTAMGRAWLATAPQAQRDSVVHALRQDDALAWQRFHPELAAACTELEQRGYCSARGDFLAGIHAVAVPLELPMEDELLVFNCGIRAPAADAALREEALGRRLCELVGEVKLRLTRAGSASDVVRH